MPDADRAQMLLGGPVVASQRKCCHWGGAEKGHVHDSLYVGVDGRVNEGEVLPDPVGGFGCGDHEHGVGAVQCCSDSVSVAIVGRRDMSTAQGWCLRWIADDESLMHAEPGESTGHP
jgi:hypothetical protein